MAIGAGAALFVENTQILLKCLKIKNHKKITEKLH
jgi:hypothetical protein